MSPIHPFGHFFEFSATANYLTTIFDEFKKLVTIALSNSGINKLQNSFTMYEQNYEIVANLLQKRQHHQETKITKDLLDVKKNRIILDSEIQNRNVLLGTLTENELRKTLNEKVRPLFFLCGTYSVFLIVLCGLSEIHENDALYLNMLLVTNTCIVTLACGHTVFFKGRSVKERAMYFHWILVATALLGLGMAIIMDKVSKNFAGFFLPGICYKIVFLTDYSHYRILTAVAYSMLACGAGFLTLIAKYLLIRVNLTWSYYSIKLKFNKCRKHLKIVSNKYIEKN